MAEEAVSILREKQGLYFSTVTITAKEKLCVLEKPDCNPQGCPRARGHFDRVNDAVYEIIHEEQGITRELILDSVSYTHLDVYKRQTIDSGTSNTRVFLWDGNDNLRQTSSREIGVKNTAVDGHNGRLKEAIGLCMEEVLEKEGISWSQVSVILASGMLTSALGLLEVPHITAPAGIMDEAAHLKCARIQGLCEKPIYFIPGIRNLDEMPQKNPEQMDIMRGEETESLSLIHI